MDDTYSNELSSRSGADQEKSSNESHSGPAHIQRIERLVEQRLGDLLVDARLIDKTQLKHALSVQAHQGGEVVKILVSMGYIDIDEFLQFLAKQPLMHRVDLSSLEIDSELIRLVPREFAEQHEVVPIDRDGDALMVGIVRPIGQEILQELEQLTGMRIKPLLCSADDLRTAIRRYYIEPSPSHEPTPEQLQELQAPLRLSVVARLVRQIDSFPALPETVHRARIAMDDPSTSIRDVADIIIMDPPIAAKVLSVANSAAYGFPQRIENVSLAITLLGLRETYSIVLSLTVLNVLEKSKHIDYKRFWIEALSCAAATRFVLKAAGRKNLTGAFAAGLLHDIGRVALAQVAPALSLRLPPESSGTETLTAEEQLFGMTHMEAGYELALHWGLPPEITEAIRYHHRPSHAKESPELVAVVCLADAMAQAKGANLETNPEIFSTRQEALDILGIDAELAEAMLDEFLVRRDDSIRDALS